MKKNLYFVIFFLCLSIYYSYTQTFSSSLCGTAGFKVSRCFTTSDAQFQAIKVSGLPGKLTAEFGLKSVYIDATIKGTFSTAEPYADLIDPSGNKYRLFNPQSFPQYNGSKNQFKVTFSACNSGGIPNANDNVTFPSNNGIYRPMGDNPLNRVNLSNVNPNGDWKLALCIGDSLFTINCLKLDFGPTCATVRTHKIVTENCQSFVQVTYDQINNVFCDNQDGNKSPDYYIKMAGTSDPITFWSSAHLKLAVPQGKSKIEFGTYYKNNQGIEYYSCPQIFEVDVPKTDTVAPKIQTCLPNAIVTLDPDGKKEFTLKHPKFTDNCGTPTSFLNINFLGGATDLGGAVQYKNLTTSPDQLVTYTVKGVGSEEFEFVTIDAAGNRTSCKTTITAQPDPNNCANDTQAPVFLFGTCRRNYVVLVNSNSALVNFQLKDPYYYENCEKVSDVVNIQYMNGATDKDGKTSVGPFINEMNPGKFFPYSIKGIGNAEVKYEITDKKGNKGACITTVTTRLVGLCANDATPPDLSSCMPNSILSLNSQTNRASFRVTAPIMSDNCGIDSTRLIMQYIGGAKGLYGETYREFINVSSGEISQEFYMVGAGQVIITVYVYDLAGNVSACSSTITARANYVDPCASFNPSISVAGNNCTNTAITVNDFIDAVKIDWKNGTQVINTSSINSTPSKEGTRVAGTGTSGNTNTQLGLAQNVAIDKLGNLYVCDSENSRVLKYAPGSATGVVAAGGNGAGSGPNQLDVPYAIQVDNDGNLYVAEYNNDRVTKWLPGATNGVVVAGGNGSGNAPNQLLGPFGISLDANGAIYVADFGNYRIQKWLPGGIQGVTVAGTGIKGTGSNQLSNIRDVIVNAAGEIFVLETDLGRVKKFPANSTQGTNGIIVANDQENALRCMSMDAAGYLYITNILGHYVKKFPPNSTATTAGVIVAGGNGQGSGANQLDGPRGVTVDRNGNIYIVDQKNYRVQKWAQTAGTLSNTFTPTVGGIYSAEITRADGCKSITNNVVIVECNAASQFVINDGCIPSGQSGLIPVTVKGFTKINALQFKLLSSNANSVSLDSITNRYFSNIQYNKLSNGDLKIVWDDVNGQEINLPDGTKLFDIVVKSTADFTTPVSVTGIDQVVVSSVISSVAIIPNTYGICTSAGISPKGKIADIKDKPHLNAKVSLSLSGKDVAETNTGADGRYAFNPVPATHRITPSDNSDIRKGVNVADVSLVRRHTLSIPVFSDDYSLVAADVNKDGLINIADVILLNRVVLEINNEFPNNTSWRFLPKKLDISSNPLKVDWPNYIDMSQPNLDYTSLDFVSIKVGDVNGSALSLNESLVTRSSSSISIPDTNLAFSKNMKIPVKYSGNDRIAALTMKIKYDKKILKFVKIESPTIPGFGSQHYNEKDGTIIISYDHPQGLDFIPTDVLMNLVFENVTTTGLSALDLSDVLFLNKNLAEISVVSDNGSVNFLTSSFYSKSNLATIQSYPNPFTDVWHLDIQLNSPDKLNIEIMDITGRSLRKMRIHNVSSIHRITINDLDFRGLINCKITSSQETYIVKAIKL